MTNPFKLTSKECPNSHIGVYLANYDIRDKAYDLMRYKVLDINNDYDLYSVVTR